MFADSLDTCQRHQRHHRKNRHPPQRHQWGTLLRAFLKKLTIGATYQPPQKNSQEKEQQQIKANIASSYHGVCAVPDVSGARCEVRPRATSTCRRSFRALDDQPSEPSPDGSGRDVRRAGFEPGRPRRLIGVDWSTA